MEITINAHRKAEAITLSVTKVTARDLTDSARMVTEYRNAGNGSNRTNWNRLGEILAGVLCAIRTGKACEVTGTITDGNSPVYHQIHRILGTDLIRPMWSDVTVVTVLPDGETTTTGKVGKVRAFIIPAESV